MDYDLEIGTTAPIFTAIDQDGDKFSNKDLKGYPYILYFYPKDDTPGCTTEACSFRDEIETLEDLGVLVIGVSPDSPKSHQKFIEKYELPFTLLADEEKKICQKFDVLQETEVEGKVKRSVIRSTFLIGADGRIKWVEKPVKVEGHVERILEAIDESCCE